MLIKMFTVFDQKAECYLQPFYAHTTGAAIRMFEDTCSNKEHQFHKHAEDFTLFEIGVFDDSSAEILLSDTKTALGSAIEYKEQPLKVI